MEKTVATIHERSGSEPVRIALVLGSGLGHLADAVDGVAIDYADLPGFPHAGVSGHSPRLVIGMLEGGRAHYYEAGDAAVMRRPLEVLGALGTEVLLLTNAAGSFRTDIPPGDLMLVSDHINYSGLNPLIGEATDRRFVNMVDAYDPGLRKELNEAAEGDEQQDQRHLRHEREQPGQPVTPGADHLHRAGVRHTQRHGGDDEGQCDGEDEGVRQPSLDHGDHRAGQRAQHGSS